MGSWRCWRGTGRPNFHIHQSTTTSLSTVELRLQSIFLVDLYDRGVSSPLIICCLAVYIGKAIVGGW